MKQLLNEWKNLDDRFIRDDKKELYKETFEQYLRIKARREVEAANQQLSQRPVDVTNMESSQQSIVQKPSHELHRRQNLERKGVAKPYKNQSNWLGKCWLTLDSSFQFQRCSRE